MALFPSLKHDFIAYRSSKVSDCIFKIYQLWQSGFSRLYSNCCCSCSFGPGIIKINRSSYKMHRNNILNSQESTTILNAHTKKVWKLIEGSSYLGFTNWITRLFLHQTRPNDMVSWKLGSFFFLTDVSLFIYIYIYMIMSRHQHGYPWPFFTNLPHRPLLPIGLQEYIPYQHNATACRI